MYAVGSTVLISANLHNVLGTYFSDKNQDVAQVTTFLVTWVHNPLLGTIYSLILQKQTSPKVRRSALLSKQIAGACDQSRNKIALICNDVELKG